MVNPSVRLRVWASQLANDDFPPVCVYSGEPADAWWPFRPFTPYRWAVPFLFLSLLFVIGLVLAGPLAYVLAGRASGHLPMKAKYARRLTRVTWISLGVVGIGALMVMLGFLLPTTGILVLELTGVLLLSTSVLVLFVGVAGVEIGLQVMWNPLAPRGRVFALKPGDPDRIVEISNVHPAFVAAAQAMYSTRSPHPEESK